MKEFQNQVVFWISVSKPKLSKKQAPGSPQEWLARASGDLAMAGVPLPEGASYENLCFHAQQAAEKALKAIYQQYGWAFRYTHDLQELVDGLLREGLTIPSDVREAIVLSSFASEYRYPGFEEPLTLDEYHEAVRHAEAVVDWAAAEIGGKS